MTPPNLSPANCPKEFQENPLPYDTCAAPQENFVPPEQRFRRLSLAQELNIPLYNPVDLSVRPGLLALFRPHKNFGIGAQMDTDFSEELSLFWRLQGSYWLDRLGVGRLNVAPLVGFRHLLGQARPLENLGATAAVAGTLFSTGLELGVDWQFLQELSLGSYTRFQMTPASKVHFADPSDTQAKIPAHYEFILGFRASVDFLPNKP